MDTATSIIPLYYDTGFLLSASGVVNHFGFESKGDGIHWGYLSSDRDAVLDAIEAYPVDFRSVMVPQLLERASLIRDRKIASFVYGPFSIPLDTQTRANLTGAVVGLERNAEIASIEWSLGEGAFVTLSRDTILELADAAFAHVQHCFAAHRAIADEIKAAADIDVLRDLDIENHEAWDA